jgi:hypothetical protein
MHYRLYFLDAAGQIRHAVDLECDDDDHAITVIQQHSDGRAMELWQARRRVMTFPSDPK